MATLKTVYCTEWLTRRERDDEKEPEYHEATKKEQDDLDIANYDELMFFGKCEQHEDFLDPLDPCRDVPMSKLYKIVYEEVENEI